MIWAWIEEAGGPIHFAPLRKTLERDACWTCVFLRFGDMIALPCSEDSASLEEQRSDLQATMLPGLV